MAHQPAENHLSRRDALRHAAGAAGVAAAASLTGVALADDAKAKAGGVTKGRIQQSIVHWCFSVAGEKWDVERTSQVAKQLGCKSVELVGPDAWPTLKKYGLTCAIAPNGMPGAPFVKGLNNPKYHEEVIGRTTKMIDAAADNGIPSVIAFNGFKYRDAEDPTSEVISLEEGADNCVKAMKQLVAHGEKKGVTVCIEHLNTRDDSHPMKGHPGYQGDDIDYVADILRRIDSPRAKLLYDIYHVQIMDGDHIRRIKEFGDLIGHVHTAGNPGRGELDETQEIYYPSIMNALLEIDYKGYVGQEFIPTRDPLAGLTQAVELCDV